MAAVGHDSGDDTTSEEAQKTHRPHRSAHSWVARPSEPGNPRISVSSVNRIGPGLR